MTATGASAIQELALQPSAIGFGFPRLVPERPEPELPAPVPVTSHPGMSFSLKTKLSVGGFGRRGVAGEDGADEEIAVLSARAVRAQGFDERFIRKWRLYFRYCQAAFEHRNIGVVQAVYVRPNRKG